MGTSYLYVLDDCGVQTGEKKEFAVEQSEGLNATIVLGPVDPKAESPNLFIERRRGGWLVVISVDSGDPVGHLVILDNKKATVFQDRVGTGEPVLEWAKASSWNEFPKALDRPMERDESGDNDRCSDRNLTAISID